MTATGPAACCHAEASGCPGTRCARAARGAGAGGCRLPGSHAAGAEHRCLRPGPAGFCTGRLRPAGAHADRPAALHPRRARDHAHPLRHVPPQARPRAHAAAGTVCTTAPSGSWTPAWPCSEQRSDTLLQGPRAVQAAAQADSGLALLQVLHGAPGPGVRGAAQGVPVLPRALSVGGRRRPEGDEVSPRWSVWRRACDMLQPGPLCSCRTSLVRQSARLHAIHSAKRCSSLWSFTQAGGSPRGRAGGATPQPGTSASWTAYGGTCRTPASQGTRSWASPARRRRSSRWGCRKHATPASPAETDSLACWQALVCWQGARGAHRGLLAGAWPASHPGAHPARAALLCEHLPAAGAPCAGGAAADRRAATLAGHLQARPGVRL